MKKPELKEYKNARTPDERTSRKCSEWYMEARAVAYGNRTIRQIKEITEYLDKRANIIAAFTAMNTAIIAIILLRKK